MAIRNYGGTATTWSDQAKAEHWTRNNGRYHTDPAQDERQSVCACGWAGPVRVGLYAADEARADGDAHRADMGVTR